MGLYNPASGVKTVQAIYNVAAGSISTSPNNVVFTTKVVDTNNAFNTGTALFTAPVAGTYQVYAKGLVSTTSTTVGGSIDLMIALNGTSVQHQSIFTYTSTSGSFYVNVFGTIPCIAGDTLGIFSSASAGIVGPAFSASATDGNVSFIRLP